MRRAVGEALADALGAMAAPGARVLARSDRPWASVTFAGARHRLSLAMPPAAAAAFEGRLGEAEFAIRGHLVADVAVVGREQRDGEAVLAVEALTIEAAPGD